MRQCSPAPFVRSCRRAVHLAAIVGSLAGLIASGACREPRSDPHTLVLTGARVYVSPDQPPIDDAVVVIRGASIEYAGPRNRSPLAPGAEVIDGRGQVVTAGFWNSHVHFIEERWTNAESAPAEVLTVHLRDMLVRHGFTTVFDTGSPWTIASALRHRIERGDVMGPRMLTVGEILFPRNGAPPGAMLQDLGLDLGKRIEVDVPAEAARLAQEKLDRGADGIKLYVATWWNEPVRMRPETVSAVADVVHDRGVLLFAHPSDLEGVETALAGGVDVLAHTTPLAGRWSEALAARMREHRMAIIPTLKLWRAEFVREGVPESTARAIQQVAVDQLRTFVRAGGEVLFGTDVGYLQDDDPREEYELMAAAGMDARQILASLTTSPSARFGAHEVGRVMAGQQADLVVLRRDPAHDVTAFTDVAHVIRLGRLIYSREPRTPSRARRGA